MERRVSDRRIRMEEIARLVQALGEAPLQRLSAHISFHVDGGCIGKVFDLKIAKSWNVLDLEYHLVATEFILEQPDSLDIFFQLMGFCFTGSGRNFVDGFLLRDIGEKPIGVLVIDPLFETLDSSPPRKNM